MRKPKAGKASPVVSRSIRLPEDVQEWLKLYAHRNVSSANAEIVRIVRDKMDAERRKARTSAAS
jgi:plasmid stability protein